MMMKMKKKLNLMLVEDITAYISRIFNSGKTVHCKDKKGTYGDFYLQKCYQDELELEYLFQVCSLFKHFSFVENHEVRMKFLYRKIYAGYRIFECLFSPSFCSIRLTFFFNFRITTFIRSLTVKINLT